MILFKTTLHSILTFIWKNLLAFNLTIVKGAELVPKDELVCFDETSEVSFNGITHIFLPDQFGNKFQWTERLRADFALPDPVYFFIRNAELRGKRALAFDGHNRVLIESTGGLKGYLLKSGDSFISLFPWFFRKERHFSCVISLVDILSSNYYHWVNDMLPLLQAVQHYKMSTRGDVQILLDWKPTSFQLEYLTLVGFEPESILTWNYKRVTVDRLMIVPRRYLVLMKDAFWGEFNILSKRSFDWIRSKVQSFGQVRRRIYISRKKASSRRVINEEELSVFLFSLGFVVVNIEDFSVLSQIQLFQETDVLVTVHGAALTNTIYGTNMKIVELYPESRPTSHTSIYYQIAHFYDHRYWVLSCSQKNSSEDIEVNMNEFKNIICRILEEQV